ncbi:MAG TPA: PhnD/SsuA/transferrin family substrate-binding protein, partial [Candidatus Wallbacteria bacterium]|nr:PhnD/SsuA/transferrin family substrate-binding protein [Candidatus Wallbacteria bacterium]
EIEYALIKGEYDIAVLPPRLFLINLNKLRYSPISIYCLGSAVYRAAVFASKKSGIESIENLPAETSVLFVDPFSASGFVVPYIGMRTTLAANELAKLKFEGFSGSNSESLKKLAAGEVDLIVSYSTLGLKNADIKSIYEFKTDIPNDILVASDEFLSKLPSKKRRALARAIASLKYRGKAMTTKYDENHIREFAAFSETLDSASQAEKARISVPRSVLDVYINKIKDEKLALAAIAKIAEYAQKSEPKISFEVKLVENIESALWDVISGDSAAIFAGHEPHQEITTRFPRLLGDEFGFYSFR